MHKGFFAKELTLAYTYSQLLILTLVFLLITKECCVIEWVEEFLTAFEKRVLESLFLQLLKAVYVVTKNYKSVIDCVLKRANKCWKYLI